MSEARAFLDTFCVFLLAVAGEGRSLVEIKKRLPFGGVGAERATAVVMLSVCAMSVSAMSVCAMSVCTEVCATVRAAAAREVRNARVGGGGVSIDDGVGTSVARDGTERTSALDRSTEMGDPVAAVEGGNFV